MSRCQERVQITCEQPRRMIARMIADEPPRVSDYLRESEMIASMNNFPGRSPYGKKSAAIIPRRAHASTIRVPQQIVHAIVQAQPQIPPTRRPVTCLNPCSEAAPRPMRRKNPPTERNSVPCPSPHIPASCINPETAKAPMSAPGRPNSAQPGREPNAMNTCRKSWCQRKPQKSVIEVDVHGRSKTGGH